MAAPLMEGREEFLDEFLLRPEITMQFGQVGDWTLPLLSGYLVQGRVCVEVVARIIRLKNRVSRSFVLP